MTKIQVLIASFLMLMLSSCGGVLKSEKIIEVSEDGRLQIEIEGVRDVGLEPFVVSITAKKAGLKPMVAKMEIYQDDITRESVKFNWKSDNQCIISISHRDGKIETVPIRFVGVD